MNYQHRSDYSSKYAYFLIMIICLCCLEACQSDTKPEEQSPKIEEKLAEDVFPSKVRKILGQQLHAELKQYRIDLEAIKTIGDLTDTYAKSIDLRDTLVNVIGAYTNQMSQDSLPDLFWLKDIMPSHQPQLVAEGTAYYLFNDYKKWLEIAQKTPSKEDDEFIALNLLLFPEDSIEYFYPAWFLQTWDYGGSSLLGRGVHQKILNKSSDIWTEESSFVFKKEIQRIKDDLLQDILSRETTYWERKSVILVELDSIIQLKYPILSKNDIIALQKRRDEFNAPEKYGIKLNQQAGM